MWGRVYLYKARLMLVDLLGIAIVLVDDRCLLRVHTNVPVISSRAMWPTSSVKRVTGDWRL